MMELLVFVGGLLALMAIGLPVVVAIGVHHRSRDISLSE